MGTGGACAAHTAMRQATIRSFIVRSVLRTSCRDRVLQLPVFKKSAESSERSQQLSHVHVHRLYRPAEYDHEYRIRWAAVMWLINHLCTDMCTVHSLDWACANEYQPLPLKFCSTPATWLPVCKEPYNNPFLPCAAVYMPQMIASMDKVFNTSAQLQTQHLQFRIYFFFLNAIK